MEVDPVTIEKTSGATHPPASRHDVSELIQTLAGYGESKFDPPTALYDAINK